MVAQGRTITETLEIARDVAKKLLGAQAEHHQQAKLISAKDSFDYPLILGTQLAGFRYRQIIKKPKKLGFELVNYKGSDPFFLCFAITI